MDFFNATSEEYWNPENYGKWLILSRITDRFSVVCTSHRHVWPTRVSVFDDPELLSIFFCCLPRSVLTFKRNVTNFNHENSFR